jgi:hypothetical protein
MSEFKEGLDAEAQRVRAEPDALERMRGRARRRRVRRQVGSGVAALAVASAGFAFAFNAFRTGPTEPMVGPASSPSPPRWRPVVVVAGPKQLEDQINDLAERLDDDGYNVEWKEFVGGMSIPHETTLQYKANYHEDAEALRREFLPGVTLEAVAWPDNRPDIQITVGADYRQLVNGAVQVRVLDVSRRPGVARAAADLLAAGGYDVVEVGKADPIYDTTIVACAPHHDEEGLLILQRYFPDADFRGEIPSEEHDVTVYIGPEFELPGAGAEN